MGGMRMMIMKRRRIEDGGFGSGLGREVRLFFV
jgi:hypothetical protein